MAQTPPSAGEIATAVGLTIPAFFSDAFDQALQGEAGYIATGQPSGAVAQIGQAVARSACRRYAAGETNVSGRQAERYERACAPYLATLNPGDELGIAEPFQGGQCATTRYVPSGTFVSNQNDIATCGEQRTWQGGAVFGPVAGVVQEQGLQGPWQVRGGTGVTNCVDVLTGRQLLDVPECGPSVGPNSFRAQRPVITALTPLFGDPDDCGNPPPVVSPRPVTPDPIGNPFRFNPVPGVDIGVDVQINPDGSITFDVGTGDVTIDPFSEIDGGGGGVGPEPIPPGDQGQPGDSVDVGPGAAADVEDPDRNLIGVLVQTIETPPRANRLFNQTESYTKGAYFVYLGGDAGLSLIDTAALTRTDQFYFAPPGCNRFRVIPNNGFSIRVTPYYED